MHSAVEIRALQASDLPAVADLHMRAFPGAALTALGREAVLRYYTWQFEGPHDLYATVALVDGRIAGFNFAGHFRHPLTGFMRRNRGYLIVSTLRRPWLLANPLFRDRLKLGLYKFRPRRRRHLSPNGNGAQRRFGVLSIAVDPGFQGRGVGQALMDDAEREARRRGMARIGLTVRLDNAQAIRFYERAGWSRLPGPSGQWTGTMQKELA